MPRLRRSTALSWVASGLAHAGLLALGTLAAISVGRREWEEIAEETVIEIRLSPSRGTARVPPLAFEPEVDDRGRTIEPVRRPDALPRTESVPEDPLELARTLLENEIVTEQGTSGSDRGLSFESRTVPGRERVAAGRPGLAGPEAGVGSEAGTTVAHGAGDGAPAVDPAAPAGAGHGDGQGTAPRAIEAPEPEYPKLSIRLGEEGRVGCAIEVDANGLVTAVFVTAGSGYPRLDRAALEALQRWRFEPARRGGIAVAARVPHVVVFRLR